MGRWTAEQLKGVTPEQHTKSKTCPLEWVGKPMCPGKTVQARSEVLSESMIGVIHVNVEITQQDYIG